MTTPLKTLKGSVIKRSLLGVGKEIGGSFYLHKYYELLAECILEGDTFYNIESVKSKCPFSYNCLKIDPVFQIVSFVECPNFNTAREPVVGRMFIVDREGNYKVTRFYDQIYHHKWLWVRDDYEGFDVEESWEWSKKWLSVLTEPADGSNLTNWFKQLSKFNLQ